MTKVYCIRPAAYSYKLVELSLYDSYDQLAKGMADPAVLAFAIPVRLRKAAEAATILTSPAQRAQATASSLSSNFQVLPELCEIRYTMEQLVNKEIFKQLSSKEATKLARMAFFPQLLANQLTERHIVLLKRVIRLLEVLLDQKGTLIVVGHGFFFKYLEVAVRHPDALRSIERFAKYYDGSKPAYNFLTGPTFTNHELLRALDRLKEIISEV